MMNFYDFFGGGHYKSHGLGVCQKSVAVGKLSIHFMLREPYRQGPTNTEYTISIDGSHLVSPAKKLPA